MAQNGTYDVALQSDNLFSDARIELIRNSVAKGAPDDVFGAMIDVAKRRNLDPLAKQITLIRFGDTWQMIVTIDGYRAIAEQSGAYAGMDAPVFTFEGDERTPSGKRIPDSATVTVYKLINGHAYPFSATVFWEEYSTGKNNWNSMPRTMLAKVAESHALRKAFPAVLSGTYTAEEMDQAIETTAHVVESRPRQAPPAQRPQPSRQQPRQIAAAPARGSDGKAIHWRNKLGDFADRNNLTEADLELAAHERFDAPLGALVGDDVETLHRELDEARRAGKLAELMAALRGETASEEIDPETGEVIPPTGTTQVTIDLPDDQVSTDKRKAAAATSR